LAANRDSLSSVVDILQSGASEAAFWVSRFLSISINPLFFAIFLLFSEIFLISNNKELNCFSSSSVLISIFIVGSMLVSFNLLSDNHFSIVLIFA